MLLLALRKFVSFPMIVDLGSEPPELSRVPQMLDFLLKVESVIVLVYSSDATLRLPLRSARLVAESLAAKTASRHLV